jgi:hypothetical protein
MLARTRNELLTVGLLALLVGAMGVPYFRMRAERDLAAHARATGGVDIKTDVVDGDHCPVLTSWVVSPLQTSVGGWIDVGAAATDPDSDELVSYAWEPAGNFANPNLAATRYRCAVAGTQSLTLTVSDDHPPKPCRARLSMLVDCISK